MRKQTKLVAVLSAAALLAMGASMTSFAAGWQKDDDGTWHYYDKDDEMITDEWKKDGSKWFYLDEDGAMLTDAWVDDEYYVGDDGAMQINKWVKTTADDDVDDPDDNGEHWYYFDSKGKKITDNHKKINGKTYYFNDDGEMRTGWYEDGSDIFYLGEEDEGGRSENQWLWLERPTDDEDAEEGEWYDEEKCDADCDDEGWYWFGSDGKMYKNPSTKKKINGKYYYFNKHGQMLYEWVNTKAEGAGVGSGSNANGNAIDGREGNVASGATADKVVGDMRYANQVEEGWRADGWYEIAGSEDAGTDGDTDWYFFDDGEAKKAETKNQKDLVIAGGKQASDDNDKVYRSRIKCNGKYFCFNELGQMQDGLQWIGGSVYFFDENGYQKTGKVANVEEEDDDTYAYSFRTKNGGNGKGENGEKDGYLYWNGKRLEAEDDYKMYLVGGQVYLVNTKGKIQKTDKTCDLEGVEEDVKVSVTKGSYKVTSYAKDKGKGEEVKLTDEKIKELIKDGIIDVPSIAIYDNIFAPMDLTKGDYTGKFYSDEDVETDGSFEHAVEHVND